uniref:Uncharacterized protein LOC104214218 n=1 Tax=Nicotiana sylvestris TaxID=4096 RepID=A0A1U7VK04_NICSY|nr:PREDICTED: uncharacterized protein LOC104214218 [Nicotiana sylvestris]
MYVKWNPPPTKVFCLNTDGAVTQGNSRAGFGGVFRDYKGNWVMGYASHSPSTIVMNIELMTLLRGLQMAFTHHLTPLQNQMDAQEDLIQHLNSPPLNHTYREQNIVADKLAYFGMELKGTTITFLQILLTSPHFI